MVANYAIIMSGGAGTRLWPKSTLNKPKQFMSFIDNNSLFDLTVRRLSKKFLTDNILISSSINYKKILLENAKKNKLKNKNIILEPYKRNTAGCILLSCLWIKYILKKKNAVVGIFPADHYISKEENFLHKVQAALDLAAAEKSLITIGIKPTYPATGYGYIEKDKIINKKNRIYTVKNFKEKPNLKKAEQFLETGNYLWNAGMFFAQVDFLLEKYETAHKKMFNLMLKYIENIKNKKSPDIYYKKIENISFDYAIAEKCGKIYVIESNFIWDDIGTYYAIEKIYKKNICNNVIKGNVFLHNVKDSIIINETFNSKKTIVADIDNIIIVETDDGLLITKKESIQKIGKYVEKYLS